MWQATVWVLVGTLSLPALARDRCLGVISQMKRASLSRVEVIPEESGWSLRFPNSERPDLFIEKGLQFVIHSEGVHAQRALGGRLNEIFDHTVFEATVFLATNLGVLKVPMADQRAWPLAQRQSIELVRAKTEEVLPPSYAEIQSGREFHSDASFDTRRPRFREVFSSRAYAIARYAATEIDVISGGQGRPVLAVKWNPTPEFVTEALPAGMLPAPGVEYLDPVRLEPVSSP